MAEHNPQLEQDDEARRVAHAAKKRRTIVNWLRVIAVLFAGVFFLGQCGMSKPKAKAAIVESCIKSSRAGAFAEVWQRELAQRGLQDDDGKLIADYCVCLWDEPLQKLSDKQIQSFSKISAQEQLALIGGEQAFNQRNQQCTDRLGKH